MPEMEDIGIKRSLDRPSTAEREKFCSTSSASPFDYSADAATALPNGKLKEYPHMNGIKERKPSPSGPKVRQRRRKSRIYLNKFRVPIYIQLCVVICILCGLCVLVVAVTTVEHCFLSRPADR